MGWFGNKNKEEQRLQQANIPKLDRKQDTYIGSRVVIKGDISGQDSVRIMGKVNGKISLNEDLTIEESGNLESESIRARNMIVSGRVNGSIVTQDKLHLRPTAHVTGNIDNPRLVVEDGAIFKGSCEMPDRKRSPKPSPSAEPK